MSNKNLKVKCPKCKTEFNYYKSEYRPFCTQRCKEVDMGNWLTESYVIEGKDYSLYEDDPEKLIELLEKKDQDEDF